MELYLIRHGNMAGDPHQHMCPPVHEGSLSDDGCEQAGKLADTLASVPFDYIYSSPLGRALQTAQKIADTSGVVVETLPWLEEWKPAEVLDPSVSTRHEDMMKASADLSLEASWKTEAGESTFQMADRIVPGFLALLSRHGVQARHGGYVLDTPDAICRMALVAHGGSLGLLLGFILGIPFRPYPPLSFEETAVARVTFSLHADVWHPCLNLEATAPR